MDLITHLATSKGFYLVFTIVHMFSKYETFIPCKATYITPDLAKVFSSHNVCMFGMPQKIVSKRDSRFLSKF